MPLKTGDLAPNFELASTEGRALSLHRDLVGRPVVLFFYPKDFTPACTAEACAFRDEFAAFRDLSVDVLGISQDDIATHQRFREAHNLPFHLLSDPRGQVAKQYRATVPVLGMNLRVTYLLDAEHRVAAVFDNLFASQGHIRAMVSALQKSA